jgi:ribosomal-protein-alanine N-acetyltransferase
MVGRRCAKSGQRLVCLLGIWRLSVTRPASMSHLGTAASQGHSLPVINKESSVLEIAREQVCVHIRWMIRRDMSEVFDIEFLTFDRPWTEHDFLGCLRRSNSIGMVAEHEDQVVGFMIYELHKTRLHLLNFAVHPDFKRQHVGTEMVNKLVGKLSKERLTRVLLEVGERNLPAQLFFRSLGFRAISVLRNFYEEPSEDAYLMEFELLRVRNQ